MMSPFRSYRLPGVVVIAFAAIVSGASSSSASISPDSAFDARVAPQRCSGAFRYAARDGNADIFVVPDAQVYAEERRLTRALRRTRAGENWGTGIVPVTSRTAMCG
jgi:hypothetical protein